MEDPLLYKDRKFDIRAFVLVNSYRNLMKGYWYQEYYVRTSSVIYKLDDLSDKMVHLTNDYVQKKGNGYGKYEQGNKISMQQFQSYIEKEYSKKSKSDVGSKGGGSQYKQLEQKMKMIAQTTVQSVYQKMDKNRLNYTFELFGLDYMVDS